MDGVSSLAPLHLVNLAPVDGMSPLAPLESQQYEPTQKLSPVITIFSQYKMEGSDQSPLLNANSFIVADFANFPSPGLPTVQCPQVTLTGHLVRGPAAVCSNAIQVVS